MINIKCGDCLELMKDIPDKSIDLILCDLPYGTTRLEWDKPIPFEPLWEQYKRIIKDNGAILLFSAQPFTTDLINSNRKMFRYEIIWEKKSPSGFFDCNRRPLRAHENIVCFYKKQPKYNPIKTKLSEQEMKERCAKLGRVKKATNPRPQKIYNSDKGHTYVDDGTRYPTDVIKFSNQNGVVFGNNSNAVKHPTQKPLPLIEYLIKTYSNDGDIVLDNCMGVGTTGIACKNLDRNFIGFELNKDYFEIAKSQLLSAGVE